MVRLFNVYGRAHNLHFMIGKNFDNFSGLPTPCSTLSETLSLKPAQVLKAGWGKKLHSPTVRCNTP
jgi:hypothetical protein